MRRFPLLLSVVVVVLLGLATSWHAHVAAQEASPAAGDVEAVARQAIAALDQALTTGDTTAIDAVFAPEYVDHTPDIVPTGGGPSGREEMKTGMAGQRSAIPDVTISVEDVLVDGDQAAVRFRVEGTLDPAAMGMPGAVQPLDVGGIVMLRIADGQVVESWDYDEFAEQLMGVAMAGQMGTPIAGTPTP